MILFYMYKPKKYKMRTNQKIKKSLLLCIIALTAMACPSDDDSGVLSQDQFVDTWKYFKYLENGVEVQLEACEDDDLITVDANGTLTIEFFQEINGECVSEGIENGTWSNEGNGNYLLELNGEAVTSPIVFESNTFYTEFVNDNGTPDDTSDDIVERDVYIRQ